ncbi:hypothetical protein COW94_01495 [Candidatus Peregrinibacteria bacterium CG22_combo_CG10-13_8_21_14_all_44_10]|nr:MAG: hypothetical protein AUK45_00695 [Candidatus Peregrinibacteria bacterium CG2_30_44_17]PIP66507.1 MAG: hypothetical protein COW94_01495 [Candidatus Peregrinibacteria bacterium CG22_combo_CG10-13_8_21_14_all_44_10]PIS04183.1 MAG: hypothetical protein COT83_01990 [Candidatus Peregrinibacteria bacterium CG10_big_fil_rev_8_21_14_0_10_44_7]PIX80295.1 MAG: hypothetical protein COZ35_01265 [Candidatus Peregrinibacteria bacterium CG_4_10_14_3_um_filter_44_21]PJB89216.1 MAG: hypothetical protein 
MGEADFAKQVFAIAKKNPFLMRLVLIDGMRRAGIISENPQGDNKKYNIPNFDTLLKWER